MLSVVRSSACAPKITTFPSLQKAVLQIVFNWRCIERKPPRDHREINLSEKLDFLSVWFHWSSCLFRESRICIRNNLSDNCKKLAWRFCVWVCCCSNCSQALSNTQTVPVLGNLIVLIGFEAREAKENYKELFINKYFRREINEKQVKWEITKASSKLLAKPFYAFINIHKEEKIYKVS